MKKYLVPLQNDNEDSWSTFAVYVEITDEFVEQVKRLYDIAVKGKEALGVYTFKVTIPTGLLVWEKHQFPESFSDEFGIEQVEIEEIPETKEVDLYNYDTPDSAVYLEVDNHSRTAASFYCYGSRERYYGELYFGEEDVA